MINGNYTPLNLNCLAFLAQNQGLRINPTQQGYIGVSTSNTTYTTKGSVYTSTLLGTLANATALAYSKIGAGVTQSTYDALINMGASTIPALGNSKPSTYTRSYTGEMTKYGWLRLIAYQAYQEFRVNGTTNYSDFLNTFSSCYSFAERSNQLIGNYSQSTTFLVANYSNMNDLITSDITGVSLSTLAWGQDLIASGRSIDLSTINEFGLPSNLLRTLINNRALTPSFNLALYTACEQLDPLKSKPNEIINNVTFNNPLTTAQEKLLYAAFNIIIGNDLQEICILLNCSTPNLDSLADLLNPKKLFPNSYQSLTCPRFNTEPNLPTNAKTYYKIYSGGDASVGIFEGQGLRLTSILPYNIANASDAFAYSMMQIKNIQTMNIEKFAQVVTNLENVADLNTGSGRFPLNPDYATTMLSTIAKGTGTNGVYTMCDFFGAMTDLHYPLASLQVYLNALNVSALATIYQNMYTLLASPGPYETQLLTYISQAEAAIISIKNGNTVVADTLNKIYLQCGEYLQKEQDARSLALPTLADLSTSIVDTYGFMDNINEFAVKTQDCGPSLVLESIADTTSIGGNCLIGSMREIRNSERLGLVGGVLDSGVTNEKLVLPRLNGITSKDSPVAGYTPNTCVNTIPIVTGAAVTPGSLAGSPEVRLIPPNLSIFNTSVRCSVLTPSQALDRVTSDNCDCWDN